MIFNGPKLLIRPKRAWSGLVKGRPRTALWLIAAAVTAAVLPAAGVVAGHLGSAVLGYTDHATAALRAAVGFIAVAGGALVIAPALTLLLLWLADISRGEATQNNAETVAMAIIWPVWTAGLVVGIPPLLGGGPEIGEAIWTLLALVIAFRTIHSSELTLFMGIRRRWFGHFTIRAVLSFGLIFVLVVVGPAVMVRSMLGAASEIVPSAPDRVPLPLPPAPEW